MSDIVEPSNDEQSQWSQATCNYIDALETLIKAKAAEIARLRMSLSQAADNLGGACRLYGCPGCAEAEVKARAALEPKES